MYAISATAVTAAILFFYFFLNPQPDYVTYGLTFGLWAFALYLDLSFTLEHRQYIARYEKSRILAYVYGKFSAIHAVIITVIIETSSIVLLPMLIKLEVDAAASMAVAYLFALLHCMAIISNDQFVRNIRSHQQEGSLTL